MRLSGRRALVTGAAGGIGRAITAKLRSDGASVVVTDRVLEDIDADAWLPGDLTDGDFCDQLPAAAAQALGGLDILVNNAGINRRGPVSSVSDEDFRLSMAVNVEAPFRLCRAVIPIMAKTEQSAIVNMASCWGVHPGPNHAVYCLSKAALASMTQCMGRDHAHQGIRVNAVCPNEVDTAMLRTGFAIRGLDPKSAVADLNRSVPIGRIATPDDIADVVAFLASDEARYICGALIEVNGGKPVS